MKAELQEKETIIQEKDAQIHEKDIQLQEKVSVQENLKQKDAIIREKKKELDKMYSYFDIQKILLEQKTRELILTQELLYQFQVCIRNGSTLLLHCWAVWSGTIITKKIKAMQK